MNDASTIAAIATAPGRGGVAVVRVSGPDAFRIATQMTGRTVDSSLAGRFFHALFRTAKSGESTSSLSSVLDDGLVLVFASPRSYTGEDVVEFQGHGGSVAPRRVLEACLAAGARLARRGEFTERAFLNGRLDLGAAEAVIDLVDARTDRAADDAVARLGGTASKTLESLYASAIDVSSQIEHALDFSEEELPEGFHEEIRASVLRLRAAVARKLSTAREGRILREGALVVLAGVPNAGKSSLMNALLGEHRAIVSEEAGTTRDSIEEWLEIGGWPVRLVDTAGLREAAGAIEAEGVARAERLIREADLIIRLVPLAGEDRLGKNDFELAAASCPKEIVVSSKCDQSSRRHEGYLAVSSKTGEGLEDLRELVAVRLTALAAKDAEETGADVTTRQKECLLAAEESLEQALAALDFPEWVLAANELRRAAESLGRVLGKLYSEDLLEALFSRFCVGK